MKLRMAFAGIVAGAVAATVLATGQPAFADTVNGTCGSGSPSPPGYGFCLYWGQNYDGSRTNIDTLGISNFPVGGSTSLTYKSSGSGQGERLGNNNGSVRNYAFNCYYTIYYDTGYNGWSKTLSMWGGDGVYPWQLKGSEQGNLLNNVRSLQRGTCIGY